MLRPELEAPTPLKIRLTRWLVWGFVLCLALGVAAILKWNTQMKECKEQLPDLKTELLTFWEYEKDKVKAIDALSKDYVIEKNLKPGDPLPPSTFYKDGPSFWHFLSKKEPIQIVSTFKGKTQWLEATVYTLLAIEDKVPEKGKPYCAIAIVGPPEIIPSGFAIFPPTPLAMDLIRLANAEVERKKAEKVVNP